MRAGPCPCDLADRRSSPIGARAEMRSCPAQVRSVHTITTDALRSQLLRAIGDSRADTPRTDPACAEVVIVLTADKLHFVTQTAAEPEPLLALGAGPADSSANSAKNSPKQAAAPPPMPLPVPLIAHLLPSAAAPPAAAATPPDGAKQGGTGRKGPRSVPLTRAAAARIEQRLEALESRAVAAENQARGRAPCGAFAALPG